MKGYTRFAAMVATSKVVMYILMYLNTYHWSHVLYSETRLYMAFLMGATMAIIMMSLMLNMYQRRGVNVDISVWVFMSSVR